jgi:ankyrin repeat protein
LQGGKTALFTAAEYGRREIVNWLITNSADINHLTNDFQTVRATQAGTARASRARTRARARAPG